VADLGDWVLGPASPWNWAVFTLMMAGAVASYAITNWALGEPEVRNWYDLILRASRAARRRIVRR